MGDEIEKRYFDANDFCAFREKLDTETDLLHQLFQKNAFSARGEVAGFELEAWLIDNAGDPLPQNAGIHRASGQPTGGAGVGRV